MRGLLQAGRCPFQMGACRCRHKRRPPALLGRLPKPRLPAQSGPPFVASEAPCPSENSVLAAPCPSGDTPVLRILRISSPFLKSGAQAMFIQQFTWPRDPEQLARLRLIRAFLRSNAPSCTECPRIEAPHLRALRRLAQCKRGRRRSRSGSHALATPMELVWRKRSRVVPITAYDPAARRTDGHPW